ncbi:MAG: phosphatidylglycerophosphatase A [Candidatus Geothermarchaeales archaeon]
MEMGENRLRRSIIEALSDRGISLDDMIEAAMALYEPHEEADAGKSRDEIKNRLREVIQSQCGDVNVHLLIKASIYLSDELSEGRLSIEGDLVNVLCDELIGMSIAEYIGGKKALFNYVRYDREKPGILSKLNVFLDDAVAGLIAGCMSKLFEDWEWSGR